MDKRIIKFTHDKETNVVTIVFTDGTYISYIKEQKSDLEVIGMTVIEKIQEAIKDFNATIELLESNKITNNQAAEILRKILKDIS